MSFLDLIEIEEEIEITTRSTSEDTNTEEESKIDLKKDCPTTECEDNPETPQIQKQNTSRSETLQAQLITPQRTDLDINTMIEDLFKVPETETRPNPETSSEIYPEIYPTTRSTACATSLASTSPQEEIPKIQIQSTQKHSKLSIFEETIIEMFNLSENIKELVLVSSPLPDLDLQIEEQLPLEDFSLLDYLNDFNII